MLFGFKERTLQERSHYRVHRQRPIDNFIVDFYCPKLKLVIEIDGDIHYTENAQEYDLQRTEILEELIPPSPP